MPPTLTGQIKPDAPCQTEIGRQIQIHLESLFKESSPKSSTPNGNSLRQRTEQARIDFTLPSVAGQIIAAGDFNGRTNETLVRCLEAEKKMATRLLKWCNTPLFKISRPYQTLAEAERSMEHDELARLAVVTFTRELFLTNVKIDLFERATHWPHSMPVGPIACHSLQWLR